MASRIAVYAGSFDPPTQGHVDVIERGAALFDELVVAVGHNPAKKYWFDVSERVELVRASVTATNVRVAPFEGLLVDFARVNRGTVLLRGLRALSDFELEFRNGLANRDLSGLETLFLLTDPRHVFVASSLVKEIAQNGGDVARYVPGPVLAAIARRRDAATGRGE
jgi:pantetheine-phosphate adenylyltransferase